MVCFIWREFWKAVFVQAKKSVLNSTQQVKRLASLYDGILATGLTDGRVQIWDPKDDGDLIYEFKAHQSPLLTITALSNGEFATGACDGSVCVWKVSLELKSNRLSLRHDLKGHTGSVNSLAPLADGNLISGASDGTIKIWDLSQGELIKDLTDKCQKNDICTAVLPDNKMAAAGQGPWVHIWNLLTGKVENRINTRSTGLADVMHLQDGTLLTDSFDKSIKIWNLENRTLLRAFSPNNHFFRSATKLSTGDIAFGFHDGTIKVWNPVDGSTKRVLIGHQHPVSSTTLLKDGTLASVSTRSDIKIWSL